MTARRYVHLTGVRFRLGSILPLESIRTLNECCACEVTNAVTCSWKEVLTVLTLTNAEAWVVLYIVADVLVVVVSRTHLHAVSRLSTSSCAIECVSDELNITLVAVTKTIKEDSAWVVLVVEEVECRVSNLEEST